MREHGKPLVAGIFAVVACFAIFYICTAFTLGYGTTTLGHARATFLAVQLGAILFMAAGIVFSGYTSDRFDPRRVLMTGCAVTIPTGLLLAPMLSGSLLSIFVFLSLFVSEAFR